MTSLKLQCRYENKMYSNTINANHPISWYIKHCPRTLYVLEKYKPRCHPEMLAQASRDIAFMDRSGLVCSNNQSPMMGLAHKYGGKNRYDEDCEEFNFNPYCYSGGGGYGFDHTTAWRKQGERWPILVITEPYTIHDKNKNQWDELTKNSHYRYKSFEPSKRSLWNDNTYTVFWWDDRFYKPYFNILMPEEVEEFERYKDI